MVNTIVKKGLSAFVSKQTNIFSAALFIILATVFSQLLGFVKYRLLTGYFGASSDLGIFFAAFRVPDFLFQVLVAGALSSSFIPIFTDYISKNKKQEAYSFTSSLITVGIISFIVISIFIIIFSYPLSALVAPGFSDKEHYFMAQLMIIIQLSQIFFILGTVITAILQSYQHFLIPGIATAFYNVGIIVGIILFSPFVGIYGAVIGVLIGSILFCAFQLPPLFMTGFSFVPKLSLTEGVVKMIKLMIPRSFTLIIIQLAATANVFFASFVSARALVIFDLAQTLVLAPVILLGQSIAQASFPALSQKSNEKGEFLSIFVTSFNQIIYLVLPISALLIVLRIPIVRLFYGAHKFDWNATVDTGLTLSYFAVSLFAQSLLYLVSRAYYALKDSKTPFFVTCLSVLITIAFSYLFVLVEKMPIYYLALAFSIGNIVGLFLMIMFLDRKLHLPKLDVFLSLAKILIATIIMGVTLYIPIKLLDQLVFDTTKTVNLIMLTGIASAIGLTSYVFFTWLLDIQEAYYILRVIRNLGNRKKALKQVEELIDGSKLNP